MSEYKSNLIAKAASLCKQLPVDLVEKTFDEVLDKEQVGSYCMRDGGKTMLLVTPGGLSRLPLNGSGSVSWNYSDEKGKINLMPSIAVSIQDDGQRVELFHGWVRDGKLVNC